MLKEVGLSERQQKKCLKELENPKHLPPSRQFAKPSKKRAKRGTQESELSQLISRAGHEMQKQGVHLWGVNTSRNHFFLRKSGQDMRRKALEKGIFQDYSTRLGLVYGRLVWPTRDPQSQPLYERRANQRRCGAHTSLLALGQKIDSFHALWS